MNRCPKKRLKINIHWYTLTPLVSFFIINFEHISHFALVFLLLTLTISVQAGKSRDSD